MTRLKQVPLYPFLFAAFPVLHLFAVNKNELSLGDGDFLITLAAVLAAAAALWLLLGWVLRSSRKAALVVSLFSVLFFSYGHVHGLLDEFSFEIAGFLVGPDKILLSIWILTLLGGSFLVAKSKQDWRIFGSFLNVVGALLIVISLVDIIPYEIQEARIVMPTGSDVGESTSEPGTAKASELRDIYYLIFDRYGSEEALKKYANFDNGEFINFLEKKGFYVASKSAANYPRTHVSLPSSLNMEHMTTLTASFDKSWSTAKPLFALIEDNQVMRFLKKRGYKYVHFGDEWAGTWRNKFADLDVHYVGNVGGEFSTLLLKTTAYYPVAKKIIRSDLNDREMKRRRILYKFDRLEKMPEVEGPKFVFAHFLIPHDPFVFDQNGGEVSEKDDNQSNIKAYLNQLIFTNKKIEEAVTQILERSKKTPIIVIQSDEGPFRLVKDKEAFEPDASLKAHALILNAYLLPGVKNPGLYQSITPVNSFRLIFNNYFGTGYEFLPDEIYTIPNDRLPYMYTNVTDKIMGDSD